MELILSGYGAEPNHNLAYLTVGRDGSHQIKWETSLEAPSFVCGGDGYLFTITEAKDYVYVYLFELREEGFLLTDRKLIEGGYLCHITYSSKNKALFGACYETGTVFSVRVEEGRFGELLYHEIQTGDSSQTITRAHQVLLNQEESILITVNIALDRIYLYDIRDGYLSLQRFLQLPQHIGPRHAVFSEDEKLLYVITEYSNELLIYHIEKDQLIQRISTLEDGYNGASNCSTLCFSKDRQYLYAANRGAQTITLFLVGRDGSLIRQQEYDCGGMHPRHMIVTEDGSYLVICNQNSDHVAVYELDPDNGGLKKLLVSIPFHAPSGIMEL